VFHNENAEDALKVLNSEYVHILITDIELPGMSGLELCEEIRKFNYHIPIFITSIYNDKEMLMKAIKLNLVDYLVKPVSTASITKTLIESLEHLNRDGEFLVKINDSVDYHPLCNELVVDGKITSLSLSEVKLLDLLIINKNKVVYKSTIEHALNPDETISDSAFRNILYRMRKKIGKDSIISVSRVGLKLLLK
jgi:DNA-binding response OmpR family regulator